MPQRHIYYKCSKPDNIVLEQIKDSPNPTEEQTYIWHLNTDSSANMLIYECRIVTSPLYDSEGQP